MGLEPTTSTLARSHSNQLSYICKISNCDSGRSRTHNLLIRSQAFFPIELPNLISIAWMEGLEPSSSVLETDVLPLNYRHMFVASQGLEPWLPESESGVLPLHHKAMCGECRTRTCISERMAVFETAPVPIEATLRKNILHKRHTNTVLNRMTLTSQDPPFSEKSRQCLLHFIECLLWFVCDSNAGPAV